MLTSRPATPSDCRYMVGRIRPADATEVAATGGTVGKALLNGLHYSTLAMVGADENDHPVCMGGVVPSGDPLVGYVWMLATTEIEKHKMSFLRRSMPWVEDWNTQFPLLTNAVDARNELHIKWLDWLGFVFIRRFPHGPERRPFIEFVRLRHV